MSRLTLQFYTRKECTLCQSALAVVKRVQKQIPFELDCIDIDSDPALRERFDTVIPVVTCENSELARSFVNEKKLREKLQKMDRKTSTTGPADARQPCGGRFPSIT